MKTAALVIVTLGLAAVVSAPAAAHDHAAMGETAFSAMLPPYEAIHAALAGDTTQGLAKHAAAIQKIAEERSNELSSEQAGVPAEKLDECRDLLSEVARAAAKLASAADLGSAREAFGELSRPLVRYREMTTGERPKVAYCPMAKKPWLQEDEKIANPYYGASMLRCGKFVSDPR